MRAAPRAVLSLLAAALLLSGCSAAERTPEPAAALSVDDAWVATGEIDGMTAMFGVITNHGDADVSVVSAASDAAQAVELHQTSADASGAMVMSEAPDGFLVPAGGSHELLPGADHVMFLDLTADLRPGDEVTTVLTLSDGDTVEVTATVKDAVGAEGEYAPDEHSGH